MRWSAYTYNPMQARTPSRFTHILQELGHNSFLGLPGSGIVAEKYDPRFTHTKTKQHHVFRFQQGRMGYCLGEGQVALYACEEDFSVKKTSKRYSFLQITSQVEEELSESKEEMQIFVYVSFMLKLQWEYSDFRTELS